MLGYVKAYKYGLSVAEYEIYKGVYCTLCRNLGRRYSPLAQAFLSFDFTLAALLKLSLRAEPCTFMGCRCPYNPAKKCCKCTDRDALNDIADAVIITTYYKIVDNLHDKGVFSRIISALLFPFVWLMHIKARRCSPETEKVVSSAMERQERTENEIVSLDRAADPTAKALAEIFSMCYDGDTAAVLYRIGYMTGRFVYILDAADDLEDDERLGNFNPFSGSVTDFDSVKQKTEFVNKVTEILNYTAGEACKAVDLLSMQRFDGIVRNIFYDGLHHSASATLLKYISPVKRRFPHREFTV